jgi:hypothetical protein
MALTQVDQGLLGTNAQYTGFKNRIINGAVNINQRGTTNSAATDGGYWMDMYATITNQGMTFNIGQNLNSITPPAGFTNYLGCQSTSSGAVPSPTTSGVRVRIEGQNMGDLGWGAAGAQTVTMSFWVRSSLTGTFGGGMWNSSQSTSYPFSYSIPVANTWTYITITIVGPTSGTFLTTNGVGLGIDFSLATGSAQQGTAGAWTSGFKQGVTGQTQVCSTSGATWYMTGLQFEKGSTATSFDYRPYGTELALCQRYYWKSISGTNIGYAYLVDTVGANRHIMAWWKVSMRASPTVTGTTSSLSFFSQSTTTESTECGVTQPNSGTGSYQVTSIVATAEL